MNRLPFLATKSFAFAGALALASGCLDNAEVGRDRPAPGGGGASSRGDSSSGGGGASSRGDSSFGGGGSDGGAEGGGGSDGGSENACAAITCTTPPSACYAKEGSCKNGVCSYAYANGATCDDGNPCTTSDTCENGVCAGTPVVCEAPATLKCVSETTLRRSSSAGQCVDGACSYPYVDTVCNTPPASTCASTTVLRASYPAGKCADGACSYTQFETMCPAGCSGGTCTALTPGTLSAGWDTTCFVTQAGALKCWGDNDFGQLGDGSTTFSTRPVDVMGLSSKVLAVSESLAFHTCALTSEGAVKCWGSNRVGEVGDGTTTDRSLPVDVVGLSSGVVAVSTGSWHACALTSAGGVKCWGENYQGELGNGSKADSSVPVDVVGLASGVVAIAAGRLYTCAVTSEGAVKCWGFHAYGMLGPDVTTDSAVPLDVPGLSSGIVAVSPGGQHICALTSGGAVKCWGDNYFGQLGNGSFNDSSVPVDVPGLSSGVVAVSAGFGHTCVLTSTGAVKCWGRNNAGQLGDGSTMDRALPVDVVGLPPGTVAITTGESHTCAVTAAGTVKCWGSNLAGALGNGSADDSPVPVDVTGLQYRVLP